VSHLCGTTLSIGGIGYHKTGGQLMTYNKLYILLAAIFAFISMEFIGCIADTSIHLNIDNQLSTDVTLSFYTIMQNGNLTAIRNLGIIHADKTEETTGAFILGGLGLEPKVILEAHDQFGSLIWEKTWTGADFVKLKDLGWKVTISSETNQLSSN
jgi:hypothetical protein